MKEGLSFSRLEIFITRASFAVPEDPQRLCPALQDSLLRLLISRVIYCWGTDTPNLVLFPGLRFCGSVVWAGLSGLSLLCMVYWGHSGSGVWWVASGTAWGPGAGCWPGRLSSPPGPRPPAGQPGFSQGGWFQESKRGGLQPLRPRPQTLRSVPWLLPVAQTPGESPPRGGAFTDVVERRHGGAS